MHRHTHALDRARTIYPAPRDAALPGASLSELAATLPVSPDDLPLEIEDLAPHFLLEATQSNSPSAAAANEPIVVEGEEAALRESFFDEAGSHDRERLREFERIWTHIISRELAATEL